MPLLLSLVLFCYLAICGRAVFCLLGVRLGHDRTWLLAPVMGLAALGLVIMVANQAGLAVRQFALPLALGSTLGSIALLQWKRAWPKASLSFYALITVAALLLAGWPALLYGWNWVGYGNDDMANYCLGADRFLRHGFYAVPTTAELDGGDYAQWYWMLHVAGLIRFGSEHMLAYVSGATGLKSVGLFLPTIIAFGLVQLTSFMGLVLRTPRFRREAVVTGCLLGLAPLWYLSLMYQLIAQVAGLALLAAVLALTARTRFPAGWLGRLRFASACSLLIAALGIYYPEVFPFLLLGWALYMMARLRVLRRLPPGLLPTAGLAVLLTLLLLLRHNVLSTVFTLLGQAQDGLNSEATAARVSLFPYFLMPAGPAFLLGLDAFVARLSEPWASVAVAGGWIMGVGALLVWIRNLRVPAISTAQLAVMILVGAQLFRTGNGFGLFKLVMFALPFLAAEMARPLGAWRGRAAFAAGALALLLWLPGIWRYTKAATNLGASVVGELFDASTSRGALPAGPAWADTTSSPVNKLLMLEARSTNTVFMSQLVGATILGRAAEPFPPWVWRLIPGRADGETAAALVRHVQNVIYRRRNILGLHFWERTAASALPEPGLALITSEAELRSFNKLARYPAPAGLFSHFDYSALHNHLVFIQTNEGQHYYLGGAGSIAIYRPQADVYGTNEHFFVIGRRLLFRVINPSSSVRLRLSMTASVLGEGRTSLPTGALIRDGAGGTKPLGLVGAGSANIYSPPLQPFLLDGVAYVSIDLGRPPLVIGLPGRGIQNAYHRNLSIDNRQGLGYCRDISLVDEKQYAAWARPRTVASFPGDLMGPDAVEYSGLYEDGWVSDHAFVVLGASTASEQVSIQGLFPTIPGVPSVPQTVEVRIDGENVARQEITPGEFTVSAPIKSARTATRIELRFAHTLPLPSPDNRPVSVLLRSIQLQSAP
jgi:hypothetical protein